MNIEQLNWTRYTPGQQQGHYESFYQRANHPTRPLAFWIRYTLFSPQGKPEQAIGELWAIFFNGETGAHIAVKEEYPLATCRFDRDQFGAQVGKAVLAPGCLEGECTAKGQTIGWSLTYAGDQPPIYLLPQALYTGNLPKAKSLVGLPLAVYNGSITVNGELFAIKNWVGSQNHNWGSKHTDRYAFGQVAGFDNAPESFLEIVSARLKFGPLWTPMLTPLVLRHRGQDYSLVALPQSLKAKGKFTYFTWEFSSATQAVAITGTIHAPPSAFVGLTYYNPPGGIKHCLNSKIATCQLTVRDKISGTEETLTAQQRALFEIFTDDHDHGIEMRA